MKKGKTDVRLTTKKPPMKPQELYKSRVNLKSKIYKRLINKHSTSKSTISEKLIDTLVYNKNTHATVGFRDCIILDITEEFLKRY